MSVKLIKGPKTDRANLTYRWIVNERMGGDKKRASAL